ncbi:hypothetical protein [Nostoc sp.]|uniref:hypothetical protein n=1 Tax=Nostoc sp. TaxID=1180 RepID=UPI002FF2C712
MSNDKPLRVYAIGQLGDRLFDVPKIIFSLACDRFLNIFHPDYQLHANYFQSPEKDFQLERPLVAQGGIKN